MRPQHGWKATFNTVMAKHNGYSADGGKTISYATRQQRHDVLLQGFRDLRKVGFKFKTVYAFRGKHMERLVQQWEKSGLSSATIQNRVSNFRTFSRWINKRGMVRAAEYYVTDKSRVASHYVATEAKTWTAKGVNIEERFAAIRQTKPRFADALALQFLFGLRSKESLLLRPHLDDKGQVLLVTHGTKGGRDRYVPIDTPEQCQLLDHLKTTLKQGESLVPRGLTYAQCRNQYYYTLRQQGISRKQGITAHGLRHEHLATLYQALTGHNAPVLGGTLRQTDQPLDSLARQQVAERAGHSRESIASAYIGGANANAATEGK